MKTINEVKSLKKELQAKKQDLQSKLSECGEAYSKVNDECWKTYNTYGHRVSYHNGEKSLYRGSYGSYYGGPYLELYELVRQAKYGNDLSHTMEEYLEDRSPLFNKEECEQLLYYYRERDEIERSGQVEVLRRQEDGEWGYSLVDDEDLVLKEWHQANEEVFEGRINLRNEIACLEATKVRNRGVLKFFNTKYPLDVELEKVEGEINKLNKELEERKQEVEERDKEILANSDEYKVLEMNIKELEKHLEDKMKELKNLKEELTQ